MAHLFGILLLFFTFQFDVCLSQGKCKYRTLSSNHTMCIYNDRTSCKADKRGINKTDVKVIVDSHNAIRSLLSTKMSASNMLKMKWDSELAEIAQRLLDQCKYKSDCDDCRAVERFEVGQNLHQHKTTVKNLTDSSSEWTRIINLWSQPKEKIPESVRKSFVSNKAYNTYSQVIWAETQFVGCGFISFVNNNQLVKLYACNYGPAGNIIEDSIYKTGVLCRDCARNSTCQDGLCI